MLNLNRLKILAEVAECGSLSGAAVVVGHTVSAVSQQIAALEHEVGARLLERHPRGVHLTEAGRLLARHVALILAEVRSAELALAALGTGMAGQLRVASFTTANAEFLPRAVREFAHRNPHVTLALTEADCEASVALLEQRAADLVLVYEFPELPLRGSGLRLAPLLDDALHVVLARDHRLADADVLTLVELAEEPWIQGAHRSSTSTVLPNACRRAGFDARIVFRVDDQMTVRGLVGAGLGIALASSLTLGATPPDLVAVPLTEPDLVRKVYAATLDGVTVSAAVVEMLSCLREAGEARTQR